jgi:hypothetical protein
MELQRSALDGKHNKNPPQSIAIDTCHEKAIKKVPMNARRKFKLVLQSFTGSSPLPLSRCDIHPRHFLPSQLRECSHLHWCYVLESATLAQISGPADIESGNFGISMSAMLLSLQY